MKNFITKNLKILVLAFIILCFYTISVYAFPGGITGRTLKTSTSGCGGCHGSTFNAEVSVVISGPDTLVTGQTSQYSLTITKASKLGAGLDIATRRGTLNPVSSNIHLSSGELTHNNDIPMTNGTVTVQFNFVAPGTAGADTIWATGIATNSNNGTGGDDWNWAISKKIVIRTPTAVKNISGEIPDNFLLKQNFPNPFNPSTKIQFNIPKNSFVKLSVFDVSGKEIEVLTNGELKAGKYEAEWNPRNFSSGIYFYNLSAADFSETKRMILVK
jgi:hypothetical protein